MTQTRLSVDVLRTRLKIVRTDIDNEVEQHPDLFEQAATLAAEANRKLGNAMLDAEQTEAEILKLVKEAADDAVAKAGDDKTAAKKASLTVDEKKAMVEAMPEVIAAKRAVINAQYEYEVAKGLSQAYYQRGNSLDIEAKLILGKFISWNKV